MSYPKRNILKTKEDYLQDRETLGPSATVPGIFDDYARLSLELSLGQPLLIQYGTKSHGRQLTLKVTKLRDRKKKIRKIKNKTVSPPPGILPKSHKLWEEWAELEVKDHLGLWYGGS